MSGVRIEQAYESREEEDLSWKKMDVIQKYERVYNQW